MLISLSKKFIFIANMKTASTAIETALRWAAEIAFVETRYGKHMTFRDISARFDWLLGPIIPMTDFFKFGVIRDPADYVVSMYNSHMHPRFETDPDLFTGNIDFDVFLNEWGSRNSSLLSPQHLRFRDESGRIAANYIMPYDNLEEGLRFVTEHVGVAGLTTMGRENVSQGSFDTSSLTADQRAWIESRFGDDREVLTNHCGRLLDPWPRPTAEVAANGISWASRSGDITTFDGIKSTVSHEDLIRALYRSLLLREPDTPGLVTYTGKIRGGYSIEELIGDILGSQEFARRIGPTQTL